MRSDPAGPARAGTQTHEVLRFLGSTYVTYATITEVMPRSRLAYEGGDDDTTVRGYRRVEATPHEPLLARLYARRMRAEVSALKALLES